MGHRETQARRETRENEPTASVSTTLSVTRKLNRNTNNIFFLLIYFLETPRPENRIPLVYIDYQNVNSLSPLHEHVVLRSVFLSSYRNMALARALL